MSDAASRRNIELKARLASLEPARKIAQRLATEQLGVERQTDTYFHAPQGRLKLREIVERRACLVWYERSDLPNAKASDYVLAPVEDASLLKQALTAALGVRKIVRKEREIYLVDNVRIHLDRLSTGKTFVEFEAVLGPGCNEVEGRRRLDRLSQEFGLTAGDLLCGSYGDGLSAP